MKKRLLPEYVSEFRDRHGKARMRFRRKGFPVYYFKEPFGTEGFRSEYRACLDGEPIQVGANRAKPGTIADAISRYYRSQDFRGQGPVTQIKNRGILEGFRAEHGTKTVANIQFEHIDAILADKAEKFPAAARNLRKQLRRLFAFAKRARMRPDNPVDDTATLRNKTKGWHAWTEKEVEQYRSHHALGTMARLALEMYLWTGNRKGDALTLKASDIEDGAFRVTQQKTGKTLVIPVAPQLAEAIIAMPPNDAPTLIANAYGNSFSVAGFGARMRKWCDAAGLPQCSTHGLRKTISNRMALSGAGNQGIKSITGHTADSEVALYTESVDQQRLARSTMERLVEWEMANRTERLATKSSKTAERSQ